MARITRNKAAEILGVSRQTISNYIKEGILGSYVGEHGILYVNSEDIEKYAQKYKMIAANEKMKEAERKMNKFRNELIKADDRYNFWINANQKDYKLVQLCRDLWREKCHLEEAKVLLCKRKLTTKGFLEQIKTREDAIADIENKIRQTNIEYNKFRSLL